MLPQMAHFAHLVTLGLVTSECGTIAAFNAANRVSDRLNTLRIAPLIRPRSLGEIKLAPVTGS